MTEPQADPPRIEIVSPSATDDEIAVVVALLSAMGAPQEQLPQPASLWAGRARHTWRNSGLPH